MVNRLLHWLMRIGMFLLRGAGWAAVGILVGFVVSGFFRLPGRVDTFALTETLLGVVITGLSIVGAFMVVFQWSTLDNKLSAFAITAEEAKKSLDETSKKAIEVREAIKVLIDTYGEKADLYDGKNKTFEGLMQDSMRINDNIKIIIEEYQKRQMLKEKDLERRQEDLVEREKEFKEIATRVEEAAKAFGLRKDDDRV